MAAKTSVKLIALDIQGLEVPIVGTAPLIMHRFAEKARKQIEDKQQKKASAPKEARDPAQDVRDSCHVIKGTAMEPGCVYGIPAVAFKGAAVSACTHVDMTKVFARGAFFVDSEPGTDLVPIEFDHVVERCDFVTVGMGTRDLRYRPEFHGWRAVLKIRYNASSISPDQIVNLINLAGFSCGVGDWRPERDGQHGTWKVEEWRK
jgi:hypothetical protein